MNIRTPLTMLAMLAMLITCQSALADSGTNYLGANIGVFFAEEDDVNGNAVPNRSIANLDIRLGHNYNRYFAIEGHLSIAGDDTSDVGGMPTTLDKKYGLGLYLRGNYWLADNKANPYLLAGVSHTRMDASLPGTYVYGTTNDLSGGIGLDYYINENTAINIEWIEIIHRESNEAQSLGIGITRTF